MRVLPHLLLSVCLFAFSPPPFCPPPVRTTALLAKFNLRYEEDDSANSGEKKPLTKIFSSPAAQHEAWEVSYKKFIKGTGRNLAALSWEGFSEYGRGAILGYDDDDDNEVKPSAFVKASDWEAKTPESGADLGSIKEIMSRVSTYDPSKQFVVVYRACGLMGCDIVKPSISPQCVAEEVRAEQKVGGNTDSGGVIDV